MQFGVENLTVTNGVASVDLAKLDEAQFTAAIDELRVAGEANGLWLPAAAGELVVATTVDAPSVRDQLLATAGAGAQLYVDVVEGINQKRSKKTRIPVFHPVEYVERAADWLSDNRASAASQLPVTEDRPRLLIPRLNRAITTEENVTAWAGASDSGLWSWPKRMEFLSNWTDNELSGFDPSIEDEFTFEVLPTAYDEDREGTVADQKTALEALQADYPEINAASIFNGVVLARRYKGKPRVWNDSYVRGITLEPAKVDGYDYVPGAYVDRGGHASVDDSDVQPDNAARLRLRELLLRPFPCILFFCYNKTEVGFLK